ncbi:MAG: hypothetical protein HGA85_09055 [Nanoarchaeota archaeon]|nr:hypothetical protein [Nanoarchaeota archaeon]
MANSIILEQILKARATTQVSEENGVQINTADDKLRVFSVVQSGKLNGLVYLTHTHDSLPTKQQVQASMQFMSTLLTKDITAQPGFAIVLPESRDSFESETLVWSYFEKGFYRSITGPTTPMYAFSQREIAQARLYDKILTQVGLAHSFDVGRPIVIRPNQTPKLDIATLAEVYETLRTSNVPFSFEFGHICKGASSEFSVRDGKSQHTDYSIRPNGNGLTYKQSPDFNETGLVGAENHLRATYNYDLSRVNFDLRTFKQKFGM